LDKLNARAQLRLVAGHDPKLYLRPSASSAANPHLRHLRLTLVCVIFGQTLYFDGGITATQ
jgi:hypothetical protein